MAGKHQNHLNSIASLLNKKHDFFCNSDAMEMMLLSFLLPAVTDDWKLQSWESSLIGSVVFIGMMFGAYSWGVISDRFGRRIGYLSTSVFTGFFGILSALSPNFVSLLVFRALVGFGLGGKTSEISFFK